MFKFEKKLKNLFYIIAFFLLLLFGCKKQSIKPDVIVQQTDVEKKLSQLNNKKYDSVVRNEYEKLILPLYNTKDTTYFIISKNFERKAQIANDTIGVINAQTNIGQYFLNNYNAISYYLPIKHF